MSPWMIDFCANRRIEVIEGMFTQPTTIGDLVGGSTTQD